MKIKLTTSVALCLGFVHMLFHLAFAQSCITPKGCEAERIAQMEERYLNERSDAFKDHRQTLLSYREDGVNHGFMVVVYRDGRVEFTGRPKSNGKRIDLATYPYLISLDSVEKIKALLQKFEFLEMPKRYGPREGILPHAIVFSIWVKERPESSEIVRVTSGTGNRLPVGFRQLAEEIFLLAEISKYSCSDIHKSALCKYENRQSTDGKESK